MIKGILFLSFAVHCMIGSVHYFFGCIGVRFAIYIAMQRLNPSSAINHNCSKRYFDLFLVFFGVNKT